MSIGAPYGVAQAAAAGGATTLVANVIASTAAGDCLAVWVTSGNNNVSGVTDTQGNTYTAAGQAASGTSLHGQWFVCPNATPLSSVTPDKITATYSTTGGAKGMTVTGCSGIAATSPVDQVPGGTSGTSATPSITLGAGTAANELLLAGEINANAGGTFAFSGAFASALTITVQPGAAPSTTSGALVVTSSAAVTATGSITSANWAMAAISLLPLPAAITPPAVSLVGATIPNQALSTGACITNPSETCYDAGLTQDQADSIFTASVGRSLNSAGRLAVTKKFWNQNDYALGKNNLANYLSYGTRVIFALFPPLTGGTAADQAALAAFLTGIKNMGYTAATASIVLWQEPEGGGKFGGKTGTGPAGYQTQMAFFGPTVNASGLPLCQDVGMGPGDTLAQSYLNAGYASGVTFARQYADYYFGAWSAGIRLANVAAIAKAQGVPFGLGEFGCKTSSAQFPSYLQYLLTFFSGLVQAGQAVSDLVYYNGQCSIDGIGDLTSPILKSTDPRVPAYQAIFDALTTAKAGNTVTVTNPGTQVSALNAVINLTVAATDSDPIQTLTFTAAGLPPNLAISAAGVITGTVTTAGNYSVTVTATDATGAAGTAGFAWTVARVVTNTVTVTSPGNQSSLNGATISLSVSATDSNVAITTFTWSLAGAPPGLSISSGVVNPGVISGVITAPGVYSVTVTAADNTGSFGTATFTWTVLTATTLPPGSFTTLVPVSPSPVGALGPSGQLSYEIAFGLTAGVSSTAPWAEVTVQFYDFDNAPVNQVPVATVTYRVPMGTNGDAKGPAVIYGRGPLRGAFMKLTVHNTDSVAATLKFMQVVGISRTIDRDDWRWESGSSPVIPGFTNATSATASLVLGGLAGATVTHGTQTVVLCSMFTGNVFLRVHYSGGPATIGVVVQPEPLALFSSQALIHDTVTMAVEYTKTFPLPRGPVIIKLDNSGGGVDATGVDMELIAVET